MAQKSDDVCKWWLTDAKVVVDGVKLKLLQKEGSRGGNLWLLVLH